MTDAPPFSSNAGSPFAAKLRVIVDGFSGGRFAIVDGGHFDDLPALLKRDGLFARSLFLDTADPNVQAAGPWLVDLDQEPQATDKIFSLVGDRPAMVFWCCTAGETVLWRHLRTLNTARIPAWAAEGLESRPDQDDVRTPETFETVMFRHWDPGVLASLMPVLDAGQFSRMIGPALEIAFAGDDQEGPKRVIADRNWPRAQPGFITLRNEQIEALTDRRIGASHKRIAVYLRDVFPEVALKVSEHELMSFIRSADEDGRRLGLESEAARKRWVYLVMASDGRVARTPGALHFIQNGEASPDVQVRIMIDRIADRLRAESRSKGAS